MKSSYDVIILMGKTGSGKETQARLLSEKLEYPIFSTGNEFRNLREEDTPLGRSIKRDYDAGLLMPHFLASYIFQRTIFNLRDGDGIIFEGTSRTLPEAELFNEVATWLGRNFIALNLVVSDEEVVRRQLARGRDVLDTEEKIKERLKEYRKHTEPALEFYKGINKRINIDGEKTPQEIHEAIINVVIQQ